MKKITFIFALLISSFTFSQSQFYLHLSPKIQNSDFYIGDPYEVNSSGVSFDYFKYYLSNLHIFHGGGQDLDLSDSVFLITGDNFVLDLGSLSISDIEKVSFGIGVPQDFNHLDISLYPLQHPLSFQTPSMHWGWDPGYSFMIVGGNSDSNGDSELDAYFELNSRGDQNYHQVEVVVNETNTSPDQKDIYLFCNLDVWLEEIDLNTVDISHTDAGVNAQVLANVNTKPVFTSAQSLNEIEENFKGEVSFYKNSDEYTVNWEGINELNQIELIDLNGKVIFQEQNKANSGSLNFSKMKEGIYFINFYSSENKLLNRLKIII